MAKLPNPTESELRRLHAAYTYAQSIDDIELLRYAFASLFSLVVEDISEQYEVDVIQALKATMDKRK